MSIDVDMLIAQHGSRAAAAEYVNRQAVECVRLMRSVVFEDPERFARAERAFGEMRTAMQQLRLH